MLFSAVHICSGTICHILHTLSCCYHNTGRLQWQCSRMVNSFHTFILISLVFGAAGKGLKDSFSKQAMRCCHSNLTKCYFGYIVPRSYMLCKCNAHHTNDYWTTLLLNRKGSDRYSISLVSISKNYRYLHFSSIGFNEAETRCGLRS